ncbi:hypothetical protein BD413DRAFT_569712 [Trametes elegans]|nr:hypothetical protein BD413DRAFT_569712 [Trametes elegans]
MVLVESCIPALGVPLTRSSAPSRSGRALVSLDSAPCCLFLVISSLRLRWCGSR